MVAFYYNKLYKLLLILFLIIFFAFPLIIYQKLPSLEQFNMIQDQPYLGRGGDTPDDIALENLFNSMDPKILLNLDSDEYFKNIEPYLIRNTKFMGNSLPFFNQNDPNCTNSNYAQVLTGNIEKNKKFIIDVVLLGFDIDFIEIRLVENFHLVDLFIIVEQDATHQGVQKPFYFEKLINTPRFLQFQSKIYYRKQTIDQNRTWGEWEIESSSRKEPINLIKKLVYDDIIPSNNAFVIQNDGDELILHEALSHFKFCELKENAIQRVYFPAFFFKRNIAWLKQTSDLIGLENSIQTALNSYLWRPGPTISPLDEVFEKGSTLRHHGGPLADRHQRFHMNLGAAVHISSVAHPLLYITKKRSIVDSRKHVYSSLLMEKIKLKQVKFEDLKQEIFVCEDLKYWKAKHLNEFELEIRNFVLKNIPFALKNNPERYPYLCPNLKEEQQLFEDKCEKK